MLPPHAILLCFPILTLLLCLFQLPAGHGPIEGDQDTRRVPLGRKFMGHLFSKRRHTCLFFPEALRRGLPVKSLRSAQLNYVEKVHSELHRGMHRESAQ